MERLLQEMLVSAHPAQHKRADYTVRELLDDFSERLDKQLKEQPEVEAVVLKDERCIHDFVYVAPVESFEAGRADFQTFVESFTRDGR